MTSSGCSLADRRADEAGAELQSHRLARIRIADRIRRAQFAAALVEQVDGERFERDQPADEARDLVQQVIQVENTRDLPSEVEQSREELVLRVALPGALLVLPCPMECLDSLRRVSSVVGIQIILPRYRPSARRDFRTDARHSLALSHPGTLGTLMDISLPLDYSAIERILPHRYPFLLVDRITEFEPDKRIVGIKNVTLNERYLAHRPGELPVLPPTILTEAVAQVGAIMILAKPENREKLIYFCRHRARAVSTAVHPGDVVVIEAHVRRLRSRMGLLRGVARVDGQVVVEGTMTFALGPAKRRGASAAVVASRFGGASRHPSAANGKSGRPCQS